MYSQLMTGIETNLLFYRRNKLLVIVPIFLILMLGLTTLPALFFFSKTQQAELVKIIFNRLSNFATIVTAGLGLLLISSHIRDRSVKMVFTKPCLPEVWLLSSFLSAILVAFVLYAGILFISSILFVIGGIPFQWGIVYITLNEFFQAVGMMSFITFLSIIMHPVLAVLFAIIFQEGAFYLLKILLASGIKLAGEKPVAALLKPIKAAIDAIYMIFPTFKPYSQKMSRVYASLRGSDADWNYLLMAIVYLLVLTALFYFLSDYFLKKKRYV